MKTILLIEDEKDLREEIHKILKYEEYKVLESNNGRDGLKLSQNHTPDIILCDIVMPEMDGFEVLEKLQENEKTSLIPFIFITALDERKKLRQGMELGAYDYLLKPFTRDELLNSIQTQLKKSEKIEQKLDAVREKIVYAIPHEMRTPLNAIMGFAQILKEHPGAFSETEIANFADSIVTSSKRLYSIIQKYLMFIDLEIKINKAEFRLTQIFPEYIQNIIDTVAKPYNRKNDYSIEVDYFEAHLKEEWMLFALQELLDNAFKFSKPKQKVLITIKKTNKNIEISIRDDGKGFSAESLSKINAFVQFDRTSFEQQGIGLGLYLSKKIIELHKGTFNIKSTQNKGTSINIQLPLTNIS